VDIRGGFLLQLCGNRQTVAALRPSRQRIGAARFGQMRDVSLSRALLRGTFGDLSARSAASDIATAPALPSRYYLSTPWHQMQTFTTVSSTILTSSHLKRDIVSVRLVVATNTVVLFGCTPLECEKNQRVVILS
jgi:hypothetical protein